MKNIITTSILCMLGVHSLLGQVSTSAQTQTPVLGYAYNACTSDWLSVNGNLQGTYNVTAPDQFGQSKYNLILFSKGNASSMTTASTFQFSFSDSYSFTGKPGNSISIPVLIPLSGQLDTQSLFLKGSLQLGILSNGQLAIKLNINGLNCK